AHATAPWVTRGIARADDGGSAFDDEQMAATLAGAGIKYGCLYEFATVSQVLGRRLRRTELRYSGMKVLTYYFFHVANEGHRHDCLTSHEAVWRGFSLLIGKKGAP